MWLLGEAIGLIALLEKKSVEIGWHFALTGGVLRTGASDKDLDIIAYPRCSVDASRAKLRAWLRAQGWWLRMSAAELKEHWRAGGSRDEKHVEVWCTADWRRVDLMILGESA